MANKVFNFATFADYKASRDNTSTSGTVGNVIANATPSATCVSYIEATGQTLIDAVNVFVARKFGAVGDLLVYDAAEEEYKWVKGGTTSGGYGVTFLNRAKLTNVVQIGFLAYKEGGKAYICATGSIGYSIWGDGVYDGSILVEQGTLVPDCWTSNGIALRDRDNTSGTWIAGLSDKHFGYRYFKEADGTEQKVISECRYCYPIPEWWWKGCKEKYDQQFVGTIQGPGYYPSSTSTSAAMLLSCVINSATDVTITYYGKDGTMTVNPVKYDWDFDKFYARLVAATLYAKTADVVNNDDRGARNTWAIIHAMADAIKSGKIVEGQHNGSAIIAANYAAARAATYAPTSAPTAFAAGKWWLPSVGEWLKALRNSKKLYNNGVLLRTYYCTSTQYTANRSWGVRTHRGTVRYTSRDDADAVVPFSEFQIEP